MLLTTVEVLTPPAAVDVTVLVPPGAVAVDVTVLVAVAPAPVTVEVMVAVLTVGAGPSATANRKPGELVVLPVPT